MVDETRAKSNFPSKLRALRTRAGLTQDELAKKAEISRRSVIRWEAGFVVPHAHELGSLLEAMDLPEMEKAEMLSERPCLNSSLLSGESERFCTATIGGREIRVLRKKLGMAIEDFARHFHSSRSTIARWESRNTMLPEVVRAKVDQALEQLCAERRGTIRWAEIARAEVERRPKLLYQQLELIGSAWNEEGDDSVDLHYSCLIDHIRANVLEDFQREELLCDARVAFAQFLCDCRRTRDAMTHCKKVRASHTDYPLLPKRSLHTAMLIEARCHFFSSWRSAQRGLALLKSPDLLPLDSHLHSLRLSLVAECFSRHGRHQKAITHARQAVVAAAKADAQAQDRRRHDLAQVLFSGGRYVEALEALPELGRFSPIETVRQCLLVSKIMAALERGQEADHWRHMATKFVENCRLDRVARECGQVD